MGIVSRDDAERTSDMLCELLLSIVSHPPTGRGSSLSKYRVHTFTWRKLIADLASAEQQSMLLKKCCAFLRC